MELEEYLEAGVGNAPDAKEIMTKRKDEVCDYAKKM